MANPNWNLCFLRALLICAAGFWIYSPALHGTWLWDDEVAIIQDPVLQNPAGLKIIWTEPSQLYAYYPLTFTVQWLEYHFWGTDSFGYHLVNVFLHILNALLVWRFLAKLGLRAAWLGGLLFTVHPANVESVAWMIELKNALSLAPFLLCLCAWIDYTDHRRPRDYMLTLVFFIIAMLCKTTMVMFPFVILLYAWWKHGHIGWTAFRDSLPFFAVSAVLGLVTAHLQSQHTLMTNAIPLGGFASRLACAGLSLAFYFLTFLFPVRMLPIYPQWIIDPPSLPQFLPWLAIAAMFLICWSRRKSWGRHAILGLGFFLVMLLPFIGFKVISFMSFTWVMDHFLYLPMLGLIGLAVSLWDKISSLLSGPVRLSWQTATAVALALLMLGSHSYAGKYLDHETLWTYTLKYNPDAWPAHDNLGNVLFTKGDLAGAISQFRAALAIHPQQFEGHNNLGVVLAQKGLREEAIREYRESLKYNSTFVPANLNLADALFATGQRDKALAQYARVLDLDPHNKDALARLRALQNSNPPSASRRE